jgi:hypothetical protein
MNSAERLLALTAALNKQRSDVAMMNAWISVFGIEGDTLLEDVAAAMQAALFELRLWERQLKSVGVPEELFQEASNLLRHAFNVTNAANSVGNAIGGAMGAGPQHTLRWSTWVLREFDEGDLEAEDLQALRDSISAIEAELENPAVPAATRRALERQVHGLQMAIRLHLIAGAEPLRESVKRTMMDIVTLDEDERDSPAAKGALDKAKQAVRTAVDICEKVGKVAEAGGSVYSLAKTLGPLLGYQVP